MVYDLDDLLEPRVSPAEFQYFDNLSKNKIIFNGEVSSEIIEKVIIPLLEMDEDPHVEQIEIILSTEGGDVYSGMALCNVIERLKTPTRITVLSMAASMGALIVMAGYKNENVEVVCYPFSVFLIHGGSYYFEGTASGVKDEFLFHIKYEEMIDKYILEHSSISKELYEKKKNSEWFLTADEAKEFGIVQRVL